MIVLECEPTQTQVKVHTNNLRNGRILKFGFLIDSGDVACVGVNTVTTECSTIHQGYSHASSQCA